ncbi:inorganic phosphate transporter [Nesterenkonia marinintestina]|uniref:inorganic phosphate transporter n=1 Tax=Nesterenkonia marinintestina TaxID=2979865 RepID=UPI0021C063CD|nr:inorganic phosphate transporter [Nesterenkonia sp. GX14115]
MEIALLVLVCLCLVPTAFLNGLHDVSNAIAVPVRTRALSATAAARLAAAAHVLGALTVLPLGLSVFAWFDMPDAEAGGILTVLLMALVTVFGWNLYTYLRGMPTSSTHGMLAALLGGIFALSALGLTDGDDTRALPWAAPALTLLISPLVAFGAAYVLVFLCARLARTADPDTVNERSRVIQAATAGVTSFGIGLQQGQRLMFLLMLAFAAAVPDHPHTWSTAVFLVCVVAVGAGALTGGWRIGHFLGHRLVVLDPMRGMVAGVTTSGLLLFGSLAWALPLSTSLTAGSAIAGAGSNQRFATVFWSPALKMVRFWIATPVVTGVTSCLLVLALSPLYS